MKKTWYALYDSFKTPIAMLLIGYLLMGLNYITVESPLINTTLQMLAYLGYAIKMLFPLIVIIAFLNKNFEDTIVVNVGIFCYFALNAITMFYSKGTLSSFFYTNLLNLNLDTDAGLKPLNMGLFASVAVILIITLTYRSSRKRYNYGMLQFITNDVWFFLLALISTVLVGALIAWQYPTVARFVVRCMRFVSVNNTNPASIFFYGLYDKVMSITGLHRIVEQGFWYGEFGGSWVDKAGTSFFGDANIWNAQIAADALNKGVGRYLTSNYVINLFVIPSIGLGLLLSIRDRVELKRNIGAVIMVIICSLLTGNALPMEFALLFIAPGLLVIHVIASALISMALAIMNVQLGFSVVGNLNYLSAGNIVDFIRYLRATSTHDAAMQILLIGAICFVIYQLLVFVYYRFLSQDFLESEEGKQEMKEFVRALGGIDNIRMITSSPLSIIVVLDDNERFDPQAVLKTKAYLIKERYFGYHIDYGPGSSALCRSIRKEMKEFAEVMEYHKEV